MFEWLKLPTIVLKFTIFLPSPAVWEWHKLERWQGGEVWEIGLKLRRWQGFLTTLSFLHTTPFLLTWQPHQFNFYFVVLDRHILARCITYLVLRLLICFVLGRSCWMFLLATLSPDLGTSKFNFSLVLWDWHKMARWQGSSPFPCHLVNFTS